MNFIPSVDIATGIRVFLYGFNTTTAMNLQLALGGMYV